MNSPFDLRKPIAIGSDHAGFDYKEELISFLEGKGLPLKILAHIVKIRLTTRILPILLRRLLKMVKQLLVFCYAAGKWCGHHCQ